MKRKILGPDFNIDDKPIKINGSISYVEQVSWIQNKTIKQNILFGEPFDAERYEKTIKSC